MNMPYIHPIILPQSRALKDDLFQMADFLWVPKNGHLQDIERTSLPPLHSKLPVKATWFFEFKEDYCLRVISSLILL